MTSAGETRHGGSETDWMHRRRFFLFRLPRRPCSRNRMSPGRIPTARNASAAGDGAVAVQRGMGGGGGRRGGRGGGGGERRGGEGGAPASTSAESGRGPAIRASNAPAVQLRLRLTNHGNEPVDVEVLDFNSQLGNFVVQPAKISLPPGEPTEADPMLSRLGYPRSRRFRSRCESESVGRLAKSKPSY